jgi:hypothetical protein
LCRTKILHHRGGPGGVAPRRFANWEPQARVVRLTPMARFGALSAMAAVALTVGCSPGPDAPIPGLTSAPAATGVQGSTVVDQGCPALATASQCPQRAIRAWLIVLDSDGREVTRVDTGDTGQFRIALSAGDYIVQGQNLTRGPLPIASPVQATVSRRGWTSIVIHFDSGVREPLPN